MTVANMTDEKYRKSLERICVSPWTGVSAGIACEALAPGSRVELGATNVQVHAYHIDFPVSTSVMRRPKYLKDSFVRVVLLR